MDDTIAGAYKWFTGGTVKPDTRKKGWASLVSFLEREGALPWQYCAFLIWYDPKTPNEAFTVLLKYNYVLAQSTKDRFAYWLQKRAHELPDKVRYQIRDLRRRKANAVDGQRMLLTKHIDASVMVRLEMACEWREELEDFEHIVNVFKDRAIEMRMCFPLYEQLTPRAWALIEDIMKHA